MRWFDHVAIEKKWQEKWCLDRLYDVGARDSTREKEYVLVELPYPSGNLHIGHWYAFAVPDIYVRFRRMQGKQVVFPIGFDAFGLPAENAALKRNVDPKKWTNDNIAFMKKQLESMGNAFSWDRTTITTDPEYYKWTQWMFTKFFERGLAYRGEAIVNWDPVDNTVIANEQVLPNGRSERSGAVVEKKLMPQWMLRITAYADRLVDDLEKVDWPEHIKEAQRQWIGRSEGAEIDFILSTGDMVTVFTTRADTLFGATCLVFAPEHPMIALIKPYIKNWDEVQTYIAATRQKDEKARLDAAKEKTGICLDGITTANPASGEVIPVFVADYVLASYGTGVIMAVPAHDERDFAFAQRHNIPVRNVVFKKVLYETLSPVLRQIIETHGYKIEKNPRGFMVHYPDVLGEIMLTRNMDKHMYAHASNAITQETYLASSGEYDGMDSEKAKEVITQKVGGRRKNTYRLRDWSVGRQRYWGVPIPIVYDPDGTAHVIPEEHLPWLLPEDVDVRPTGEPPLAKSEELKKRTEQIFGKGWTPEVETMDTFVDSSWYFLRYIDNQNNDAPISRQAQHDWMPVDIYFGGAEHTTMHLLYSRFWQKLLFDIGIAVHDEPYRRRINRGLILGPDGNKMSKSKGNVIDPDEQVRLVGADTVKMYLAFMGPYEGNNYPWDMGGIAGIRRFLERVYGLVDQIRASDDIEVTRLLHKTIKKVGEDIVLRKFNTAVSGLMIFVNTAEKRGISEETLRTFVRVLAPFAPHVAEELWSQLTTDGTSVHAQSWPAFDEAILLNQRTTIAVQVNGKSRGVVVVERTAPETVVKETALQQPEIARHIHGTLTRVVYVPGRIINLIVTP